jgi:hypothetical protein
VMKNNKKRKGFVFKTYEAENQSPFEKLFEIFKELITHTSGDFDEAIDWMRSLDVEYEWYKNYSKNRTCHKTTSLKSYFWKN